MLGQIFGAELEFPVRVAIALVVIAALLGLTVLLMRRMSGGGARAVIPRGRGTPRLAVMDSIALDQRRRLVLVRRDETEHLLLVGGTADVVVEKDIAPREPVPLREAPPQEIPQREAPQRRPLAASAAAPALAAGSAAAALAAPAPLLRGSASGTGEPARDPFAEALSEALKLDDGPVPAAATPAAPATDLTPPEPAVATRTVPEPARGADAREPKRPILGRRPLMRGDGRLSGQGLSPSLAPDAGKPTLAAPRDEAPRAPAIGGDGDRKAALPPVIAPRAISPLASLGLGKSAPKRERPGLAPAAGESLRGSDEPVSPRLDPANDKLADADPAPQREAPRITLSDLLDDGGIDDKPAAPSVAAPGRGAEADAAETDPAPELPAPTADDRSHVPVLPQRPRREPLLPFDRLGKSDSRSLKGGPDAFSTPLSGSVPPPRPREFSFQARETPARTAPVIEPTWPKGGEKALGELRGNTALLRAEPAMLAEETAPAPDATALSGSDAGGKTNEEVALASIGALGMSSLGLALRDDAPSATAPDLVTSAPEIDAVEDVAAAFSVTEEPEADAGKPADGGDPFDELDAEMANLLGRSSAQGR